MSIWLPPKTDARLLEERRRREATALTAVAASAKEDWLREFDAQLGRIVDGMELVPCPDPAPLDAVAAGFAPGRWNLMWPGYNGGPVNILPLVMVDGEPRLGGDGEYVEPGSWVFDQIARADMWSERVQRDRRRIQREAEEAKARRLEQERRDRDEETFEHYLAATRTQVSMNRDTPWTQNAAGRKARKV